MTKGKQIAAPPEKRADIVLEKQGSESDGKALARLAGSPTFRAAVTERQIIGVTMGGSEMHLADLTSTLTERFLKTTKDGDMAKIEAMLLAQAHTCEAIFHEFARRSLRSDSMPRLEAYMRMALKAQAQSAHTIKVLGELKNPRAVAFVKQQNVANGPQQVNNGVAPSTVPRAHEEHSTESNELLANDNGAQTLDTGAKSTAGRSNSTLEAMGAVNRAPKRRR